MKPSNPLFEKRFKERFTDFEAELHKDFWKDIEPKIPGPNNTQKLTVFVLLLLIGGATYYFLSLEKVAFESISGLQADNNIGQTIDAAKDILRSRNKPLKTPIRIQVKNQIENTITLQSNQNMVTNGLSDEIVVNQKTKPELSLSYQEIIRKDPMLYVTQLEAIKNPQFKSFPEIKPQENKGISWYVNVSPILTYHSVVPFLDDDAVITGLENSSLEPKKLGINISLGAEFKLSPKINLYGGFSFHTFNTYTKYTYHDYLPNDIEILNDTNGETTINLQYDRYDSTLYLKNYSLGLESGIKYLAYNRSYKHYINLGFDWQNIIKSTDMNSYKSRGIFYLVLKNQAVFNLGNDFELVTGPELKYALFSKQFTDSFRLRPFHFGFSVGVRKGF